jgi:hypothetical protein
MLVNFTLVWPYCTIHRGHLVIKFVSDLRQVGGFLRVLRFPPPIKLSATIRWHQEQSSNHYMRPWIRGTWIKYFICFWCLPSSKFNFERFASICYKSWHKTVCCRITLIKILCTFIGTFVVILKGYVDVDGWFRTTNLTKLTWIRVIRRVWRYQRGNHNPYIEEQTQWPK